jgi:hypothetical protein
MVAGSLSGLSSLSSSSSYGLWGSLLFYLDRPDELDKLETSAKLRGLVS